MCNCEKLLCRTCSGSGEGMYDGSTCTQCNGRGVMPCACEIEAAEYAQYLHDEALWDAYKELKYIKDIDKANGEV